MAKDLHLSRRALVSGLASTAISKESTAGASTRDLELLILQEHFDRLSAELDQSINTGSNLNAEFFEKFDVICGSIANTPAFTLEGLLVKAKVACWSLLGDLDVNVGTFETRMSHSIIRDLILAHAPHLHRPGEISKLINDSAECA